MRIGIEGIDIEQGYAEFVGGHLCHEPAVDIFLLDQELHEVHALQGGFLLRLDGLLRA